MLSVLIVNYNVKCLLENCLLSVLKASKGNATEILVWDNASSDNSRDYLETKFSSVHFVWSETNIGFGTANNELLKLASGEHVLFLNPDTIIPENALSNCIDFFSNNGDCGALGVRMIDGSGKFLRESKRSFPSASATFFKMFGLSRLFPSSSFFSGYYAEHFPENKTNEVDVLSGAFMMVSKKAIDITKGFDPAFFMYGEDVDLSYRLKKAGFSNYYFAEVTIIHFKGESMQRLSRSFNENFYGAMKLFVDKHYARTAKRKILTAGIFLSKVLAGIRGASFQSQSQMPSSFSFTGNAAGARAIIQAVAPKAGVPASGKTECMVYCEGEISNEMIIDSLQKNRGGNFMFHMQGAESVVGSPNKKSRGIVISKP